MTRDRRGFHYALEPVRQVTDWDIDQIGRELAPLNDAVAGHERKVGGLQQALSAAQSALMAQRRANAVLDVTAQRAAHGYLVQVQQQLAAARDALRACADERDAVQARLLEARRRADSLERDRDAALAEHDLATARRAFQQADDIWLQRLHWRKSQ
ncbi:hypothetical protein GCM10027277_07700 [Pseudoduganella ginsengisoli]